MLVGWFGWWQGRVGAREGAEYERHGESMSA